MSNIDFAPIEVDVPKGYRTPLSFQVPEFAEARELFFVSHVQRGALSLAGGAKEIFHRWIRLHQPPAQTRPCEEWKGSSKEINQLPSERFPVPFHLFAVEDLV